ncbi:hypothetical protein TcasGA2_TC031013 [Tribolium castaneum]|uniref:VWFC domain-containing protein n=1 Tax=Tribolium castaneum TaxID=7070 RepID=A0A139WNL1_TRICA|nr:hypothetical protein TcasGA2_TC031013 [Tribolium castaneum]
MQCANTGNYFLGNRFICFISFICAVLDCLEWLGTPIKKGCYRKYSLEHCCSVGEICPPFDEETKCIVDGREYKEGDQFYPKNTCFNCVCQKGFNGKFEEPFCRRTWCGEQLGSAGIHSQDSCVPYYRVNTSTNSDKVLCCPNGWICPDGSEIITGDDKPTPHFPHHFKAKALLDLDVFKVKVIHATPHFCKANNSSLIQDESRNCPYSFSTPNCIKVNVLCCVTQFLCISTITRNSLKMEPIRKSSIYNTPEDIIVCPYDKNHILLWFRLERHIWKCHRADKEKQRALREVMMKEEEENWDHFNEPSYLDFLKSKGIIMP